jgi:tRNA-(ms[2]io[6]A)-hydroxylase
MVLDLLKKRGLKLGLQRKDVYVNKLAKFIQNGGSRKQSLTEKLLFSAMIEARSCERFKVLSQYIIDPELSSFYRNLMVSEAGHYKLFLELAIEISGNKDKTMERWQEWLDYEGEIMASLELRGDRVH